LLESVKKWEDLREEPARQCYDQAGARAFGEESEETWKKAGCGAVANI